MACTGQEPPVRACFGEAIELAGNRIANFGECVLVIEAPLSTLHNNLGNPTQRGAFEEGREWYRGAGAVTLLAARRFLEMVASKLEANERVFLAEAYLSNKGERTAHTADAATILREFWETEPEALKEGVEPILGMIKGVPQVRIFRRALH